MAKTFMTFEERLALGLKKQGELLDAMYRVHGETIQKFHSEGAFQVVFCGNDWEHPVHIARNFEETWDDKKMEQAARERGIAIFTFSWGGHVDDLAGENKPPRKNYISRDTYLLLTMEEKLALQKQELRNRRHVIDMWHRNNFCVYFRDGIWRKPAYVAKSQRDMLTQRQIESLAAKKGRAIFYFVRPVIVDDMRPGHAGEKRVIDPETISYDDFKALPSEIQRQASNLFWKQNAHLVSHNTGLGLCGGKPILAFSTHGGDPSSDEITRLGKQLGHPVMVCTRLQF